MIKYNDNNVVIHSTLDSGEDLFVKDQWKREYHFKFATFELPVGLIEDFLPPAHKVRK